MDSYVDLFQAAGGSMVMLAKGNRSQQVRMQLLAVVFALSVLMISTLTIAVSDSASYTLL